MLKRTWMMLKKKLLSPLTKEEQDIFNILLQKVNNNMNALK